MTVYGIKRALKINIIQFGKCMNSCKLWEKGSQGTKIYM